MRIEDVDVMSFMVQEGCYVISDGVNRVVGYQCDEKDYHLVDKTGDCLFITYAEGDLRILLTLMDMDNLPRCLIYVREGRSKIRKFNTERMLRKALIIN